MTGRDRRSTRTGRSRKVSQPKRRQRGPTLVSVDGDCSPEEFMKCLCRANGVVRSDLTGARSLRNFFEIMEEGRGQGNLALAKEAFQRVEADLKEILGHEHEEVVRSAVETVVSLAENQIPPSKLTILRQAARSELPF